MQLKIYTGNDAQSNKKEVLRIKSESFPHFQRTVNHWLKFCNYEIINLNHLPMIIKLPIPFFYARHKETRINKPLTKQDRIKSDRLVMILLFVLVIVGAAIFA
jgi:hypothetical protein